MDEGLADEIALATGLSKGEAMLYLELIEAGIKGSSDAKFEILLSYGLAIKEGSCFRALHPRMGLTNLFRMKRERYSSRLPIDRLASRLGRIYEARLEV